MYISVNVISRWIARLWGSISSYYHFMVITESCGNSDRLLESNLGLFEKIKFKKEWDTSDFKYVLTFTRLVKSKVRRKSANSFNLLLPLEPVSTLKSPVMIRLSNFDRSWSADWVVSLKKFYKLLLLENLKANKISLFFC